ncbi:hypothetical protein P3342_007299 [Pyrenophora teres f. teres]|nr:hypothetical protein P3342_007299 [Pyrenophora teres f. teres]
MVLSGVNEAQHLQNIFEQEERDDELHKHTERELRESNRKLKQKLDTKKKAAAATRRKEAAERARLKREEVAKRKAERERQKQERDAAEATIAPKRQAESLTVSSTQKEAESWCCSCP